MMPPPSTVRPLLVATDLDGTLLRSDGSVSARTRAALAATEAAGIRAAKGDIAAERSRIMADAEAGFGGVLNAFELMKAMIEADIFIGVSKAGAVSEEMVRVMNPDPIVFAMANPVPEIMPDEAKKAGAAVIATSCRCLYDEPLYLGEPCATRQ